MVFKLIDTERKPKRGIEFKLVSVEKPDRSKTHSISTKERIPLEKNEYERWSRRYDADHPWWVSEEARLRSLLQSKDEFG